MSELEGILGFLDYKTRNPKMLISFVVAMAIYGEEALSDLRKDNETRVCV